MTPQQSKLEYTRKASYVTHNARVSSAGSGFQLPGTIGKLMIGSQLRLCSGSAFRGAVSSRGKVTNSRGKRHIVQTHNSTGLTRCFSTAARVGAAGGKSGLAAHTWLTCYPRRAVDRGAMSCYLQCARLLTNPYFRETFHVEHRVNRLAALASGGLAPFGARPGSAPWWRLDGGLSRCSYLR